jgi:uncharacterized protein YfkK (UPF0435 family)
LRDLRNEKSMLGEMKQKFDETLTWCNANKDKPVEFMEEDGSMERWEGTEDIDKIITDVSGDLEVINKRLSEIDEKIEELVKIYEFAKSKRSNKAGI